MSQMYMLDTNTVSILFRDRDNARIKQRLRQIPIDCICISVITEAELLTGLRKKPEARKLAEVVEDFLSRVEILPWDSAAAASYAQLRADCEARGKILGNMDMLIAAHAHDKQCTLVSNDRGFENATQWLTVEDWTAA